MGTPRAAYPSFRMGDAALHLDLFERLAQDGFSASRHSAAGSSNFQTDIRQPGTDNRAPIIELTHAFLIFIFQLSAQHFALQRS